MWPPQKNDVIVGIFNTTHDPAINIFPPQVLYRSRVNIGEHNPSFFLFLLSKFNAQKKKLKNLKKYVRGNPLDNLYHKSPNNPLKAKAQQQPRTGKTIYNCLSERFESQGANPHKASYSGMRNRRRPVTNPAKEKLINGIRRIPLTFALTILNYPTQPPRQRQNSPWDATPSQD